MLNLGMYQTSPGLMYLIHNETNQKCRIAALGALTTLIEASKHYFLAADTITGTVLTIC